MRRIVRSGPAYTTSAISFVATDFHPWDRLRGLAEPQTFYLDKAAPEFRHATTNSSRMDRDWQWSVQVLSPQVKATRRDEISNSQRPWATKLRA